MFRLLAIVAGVSIPLVVAYLIWRSSARSEIDPVEILDAVERLGLPASAKQDTIEPEPASNELAAGEKA